MNRSWQARPAGSALWRGLLVMGLAGLIAGCSLFGGDSSSTPQPAQPSQGYPNLGTVPQTAPATTSSAERQQITSGLVADQQNAAYSDQPLTAQSEQQGSPPPAPVTTITPSATADATGTQGQAATAATDTQAQAAALPQPAESTAGGAPAASAAAPALPQPELPAAPQPTSGITPLAPPPNPLPPAPAAPQLASALPQAQVSVDQAQLGGAPAREQLYPAPYAPFYGAPAGGAPGTAYSAAAGLPAAGSPVAVIFFEDGSASLSNRAMNVLKDVALIQQQQGGQLRLIGHASERTAAVSYGEHEAINQRFSIARANAVARALIQFGAPQGTISISAVGAQQPVYYEFMPTGEAGNRRVEVFLDR